MTSVALLAGVFALTSLAVARRATANVAAPPPPSELGALAPVGGVTPLEVKSAALRIDCETRVACQLEVTYEIANPTDTAIVGIASFYALTTTDVAVTIDGTLVNVALTPEQQAAHDRDVARASNGRPVDEMVGRRGGVGRQGFALNVSPHVTAKVVVTGRLLPLDLGGHGYDLSPDHARHLLLTPNEPSLERIRLAYLVAPIRTWGAVPKAMTLTLSHPAQWQETEWGAEAMTERVVGGKRIREGVVPTSVDTLSIDLLLDRPFRLRGGAFVAIGGHVDDATGVRLRAGGEMSWRGHRLISLAVEVARGDDPAVVIVPAFALATPMVLIIPSLSIGAGVPVRVSPEVDVGARVQLDVHFGPVGYFVAFDGYPGMESGPRRFEVSMMAQLSL